MTELEYREKQYTIKEAHEKTRIPLSTLSKACKDGTIKATEVPSQRGKGYTYYIPESELKKFQATRKAAVSEPKSIEDVSAIILTLVNDAYDRGYKAGKADAKAAIKEALKG